MRKIHQDRVYGKTARSLSAQKRPGRAGEALDAELYYQTNGPRLVSETTEPSSQKEDWWEKDRSVESGVESGHLLSVIRKCIDLHIRMKAEE